MKKNNYLNIFISFLIVVGVFVYIGPTVASALEGSGQNGGLSYDVEIQTDDNNFSQIFIRDSNGKVTLLTDEATTHANPDISGTNAVWMAQISSKWQIFYHQIQTGKTIQLTSSGNNVNPKISGDKVAWEGFRDGVWQIFMFDSIRVSQITSGSGPKQDVEIDSNSVTYSQKEDNEWQIHLYDISNGTDQIISGDTGGKEPKISDQTINWVSFDDYGEITYEFDKSTKKIKKLDRKDSTPYTTTEEAPEADVNNENQQEDQEDELVEQIEPVTTQDIIEEISQDVPESTPSSEETPLLEEEVEESTSSEQ